MKVGIAWDGWLEDVSVDVGVGVGVGLDGDEDGSVG